MSKIKARTGVEAREAAEAEGLVCIMPDDFELLLDLDIPYEDRNDIKYSTFSMEAIMQENGIIIMGVLDTRSKNGNTHRYLWISEVVSQAEAIALQCCLKSDPVREMLSLIRVMKTNGDTPVALFETEENAQLVYQWREDRADDYEREQARIEQGKVKEEEHGQV